MLTAVSQLLILSSLSLSVHVFQCPAVAVISLIEPSSAMVIGHY